MPPASLLGHQCYACFTFYESIYRPAEDNYEKCMFLFMKTCKPASEHYLSSQRRSLNTEGSREVIKETDFVFTNSAKKRR